MTTGRQAYRHTGTGTGTVPGTEPACPLARLPDQGFTLLEVLVAFSLIVVVVFATVLSQSQGYLSSTHNRNIITATYLARNLINQEELKREGKSFDNLVDQKDSGTFETNKDFKYTIEYSKVDFSALTDIIARETLKQSQNSGQDPQQLATVFRIFKDYMEKSVRRMKVTIEWPEGKGTSQQTFSELLVDYDQDFNVGI